MSTKYRQAFGDRVRQIREGLGLSQEALANQAKLHRTHISLIERGQRNVRLETVERLAKALRVQPADLVPEVRKVGKRE
ncbi:MAG: helix-turn-helix transcriptional regulator [Phycisphaeraceae bacterium]|nr:helix-turn-helix transcriptional regulator [Phycisphaeraceae bacterium]